MGSQAQALATEVRQLGEGDCAALPLGPGPALALQDAVEVSGGVGAHPVFHDGCCRVHAPFENLAGLLG
eukprot:6056546-Pyramimonas_sp.AAC.1